MQKLQRVREELTTATDILIEKMSTPQVIYDLMSMRGYTSEAMFNTLYEVGIFRIDNLAELMLLLPNATEKQLNEWGFLTTNNNFILAGRYSVPIRDMAGKVTAIVGWYPDGRKYITTPTYGFSKDTQFFNIETFTDNIQKHNGVIYLVEGIFDALSLRSLGLPVYANMGLEMSSIKSSMLSRHSKVIAIPDNDNAGRSASPYTNGVSGKKKSFIWQFSIPNVFIKLPKKVKDCDDLVRDYQCKKDLYECRDYMYIRTLDCHKLGEEPAGYDDSIVETMSLPIIAPVFDTNSALEEIMKSAAIQTAEALDDPTVEPANEVDYGWWEID